MKKVTNMTLAEILELLTLEATQAFIESEGNITNEEIVALKAVGGHFYRLAMIAELDEDLEDLTKIMSEAVANKRV